VGQQPGPIARFAGVGRRRKRRLGGLATAQEHAPCSGFSNQLCWVFSDFLLLAVLHPSALPGVAFFLNDRSGFLRFFNLYDKS
jgi:hypothetical protein